MKAAAAPSQTSMLGIISWALAFIANGGPPLTTSLTFIRRSLPLEARSEESEVARSTLERLYRIHSDEQLPAAPASSADFLPELPLFRVQWTVLPGHASLLNIHVPHYCHMFQMIADSALSAGLGLETDKGTVFGSDGPRFGHLLLEGGSASLDKPESLLLNGTRAPTVGTLMRLREMRRHADGRLAIYAEAIGRIRVLRGTQ